MRWCRYTRRVPGPLLAWRGPATARGAEWHGDGAARLTGSKNSIYGPLASPPQTSEPMPHDATTPRQKKWPTPNRAAFSETSQGAIRMNKYGRRARDHWMRYAPTRYEALEDPEEFFTSLGEQVATQVDQISQPMEAALSADLPYLEKVGQMNAIRNQAEEAAMADLVYSVETEPSSLAEELQEMLNDLPSPDRIPDQIAHIYDQAEEMGVEVTALSLNWQEKLEYLTRLRPLIEGADPEKMSEPEIRDRILQLQDLQPPQ